MTAPLNVPFEPISLPDPERALARRSGESLAPLLAGNGEPVTLRFADPRSGEEVEATLPAAALRLLAAALAQMAEGHPVTILPLQAELSTQQAAERMGVSRPYFVKLLEQCRILFRQGG